MNWMERLIKQFGGRAAAGMSKHQRGRRKSRGVRQKRKAKQKAVKVARRRNR